MSEVNIAYYRKENWKRLLDTADDREILEDTWDEWHEVFYVIKRK